MMLTQDLPDMSLIKDFGMMGTRMSTPQKYKTMLLLKFGNLNIGNVW